MNPKVVITSSEEFDMIINNLNGSLNRIRDLFNEETKSMNMLFDNPTAWSGRAQSAAHEKYSQLSSLYPSITDSLNNYIKFLTTTSNNYKAFEASIASDIDLNASSLDVNS